jgi:rSAM/selenodomain-associated transferase 2/rSAM/selenodomain-associated transferase 1
MAKDPTSVPVKTRLATTAGTEATGRLFRAFILDEIETMMGAGFQVLISLYPAGDGEAFRKWLGAMVATLPQTGEDLGERITSSLSEAMARVEGPVVTISSDVPDLPAGHVLEALRLLEGSDVVLASSSDGGFHLVAMRRDTVTEDLFGGVPWSTGRALAVVRERLEGRGLAVAEAQPWYDVDEGSDLDALRERLAENPSRAPRTWCVMEGGKTSPPRNPWLSVVIPVLHEERTIGGTIERTLSTGGPGEVEVIVVDGDPRGSTLSVLGREDVVGITAERGRGTQMNVGARRARGDVLLFLHADTLLPDGAVALVREALARSVSDVGAFDISYGEDGLVRRMMGKLGNFRAHLRRVPYGDQGPFMTREVYEELGGFPDVPIMEDVEMMMRVKRSGREVVFVETPVHTSVRRFHHMGFWRTNARNMAMLWMHRFGLPPEKLVQFYPPQSEERSRWHLRNNARWEDEDPPG